MIDFHSHILPAMDDGAADTDASLALLRLAAAQGAEGVVASPHFYWGQDTIESFLIRREQCFERLRPLLTADLPAVRLGAEVYIREGISRLDLRPLCLEGTEILLVEIPFARMPYWLMEELETIVFGQRLTVMLAHLDRYTSWYSAADAASLAELPEAIIQLNADSLADKRQLKSLAKWLPDTYRLVMGSDMHNMEERPPHLAQAQEAMRRHREGRVWLGKMAYTTEEIFPSGF